MNEWNPAKNVDNDTRGTDQCSFYDSVISTCGCGGNSIEETNSMTEKGKLKTQDPTKPQGVDEFDETPKFWERLSDVAQFLIGVAPPVKFVRCFESSSVDESLITMPRALDELANEYDERNKSSMWSISESTTAESALYDTDTILTSKRSRSGRWGRLRKSRSSQSDGKGSVTDTYLSKMKIMKSWSGKLRADTKSRSTKRLRRDRSVKVETKT